MADSAEAATEAAAEARAAEEPARLSSLPLADGAERPESRLSLRNESRPESRLSLRNESRGESKMSLPPISPQAQHGPLGGRRGDIRGVRKQALSLSRSRSEPSSLPARKVSTIVSQAFLKRQMSHSSVSFRQQVSRAQREQVSETNAYDDKTFHGAKGLPGFRKWLEKTFGSVIAGWRELDQRQVGRLSFGELCAACRRTGYHGQLKTLWAEMDPDGTGYVSVSQIDPEVDPELGRYVATFKAALKEKHGDLLTAWRKSMDPSNSGHAKEQAVADSVASLGLDLEPKRLYGMLATGPRGLTLEEFDIKSHKNHLSGRQTGLNDPPKLRLPLNSVEGLKAALVQRCGSLWAAWREHLDVAAQGRIGFGEFVLAVKRMGLTGELKSVWRELGKDERGGGGLLVFGDLDPRAHELLTRFRALLGELHGTALLGWIKVFDAQGKGAVPKPLFLKACSEIGFAEGKELLKAVAVVPKSSQIISLEHVDVRAHRALLQGNFREALEPEEQKRVRSLELSFEEKQDKSHFYQSRRAYSLAKHEDLAGPMRMTLGDVDQGTELTMNFQELCVRKYGSMGVAWRQCLDVHASGKLSREEFTQALRRLGVSIEPLALWRAFDGDRKGCLTLEDLDTQAHRILKDFHEMLGEQYGDLTNAFKVGFGKDTHAGITEKELAEVCANMGYPHDVRQLYRALQEFPGKGSLTIWEIEADSAKKRAQGQVPLLGNNKEAHLRSMRSTMSSTMDSFMTGSITSSFLGEEGTPARTLRQVLRQRYGSTVSAWRFALDPEMRGTCLRGKFVLVAEKCAFGVRNVEMAWEELSRGRGLITFKDLDPAAQVALDSLRSGLLSKHGNLNEAWEGLCRSLKMAPSGTIDKEGFAEALDKLGNRQTVDNPKRVFKALLANPMNRRFLTREDLQAILIGIPKAQAVEAWDEPGSPRAQEVPHAARERLWEDPVSQRGHQDRIYKEHHDQDVVVKDLKEFKGMLRRKFGGIYAGWRKVVDPHHNGFVAQNDFSQVCNRMGVRNPKVIWAELDHKQAEKVTLADFDAEVGEPWAAFEERLIASHGSITEGWRKEFETAGSGHIDMAHFSAGCKAIGFEGSAEKLFLLVLPEAGRSFLTFEELWHNRKPSDLVPPTSLPPVPGHASPTGRRASEPGSPASAKGLQRS